MKTVITVIAVAGLIGATFAQQPNQIAAPGPEQQKLQLAASPPVVSRQERRELKVLELSGSGYERGLHHGKQLQSEIAKIIRLWKEDLRNQSKQDPNALVKSFLAETNFTPAIKRWTPDLLDEVRGIAEGSGQPFETVFAFQLIDEFWVFLDKRAANRCSALGVVRSDGHPAYVAQNMDLESFRDGFQVVLHIAGNEFVPEQFVLTSAGLIALNGINRHSIAITCNTLMQLSASPDGLPVAFVVRGVLAQTNGDEALRFVRNIKHASGQNYIVGTGDRIYDFEASAGKIVEFRPVPDGSVVYHTNHPLVNDDLKPLLSADSEKYIVNSQTRLASLQTRLGKPASAIDEGVIKETLRSKDSELHPVCRSLKAGASGFTFGATIMTLSGAPSLEVTMGPPDVNPFVRLGFSAGAGHSTAAEPPGRQAEGSTPPVQKTAAVEEPATGIYPMQEGFVDADGVLIYFKAFGRGTPLVILHGGPGGTHDCFLPYLLPLTRRNRLVFIDERGSGKSEKLEDTSAYTVENMVEDVEALRNALKLGKIALLGHSCGGVLAQAYAFKYQQNLTHLILCSTFHSTTKMNEVFQRMKENMPAELRQRIDGMEKAGLFGQGKEYQKRRYTSEYMTAAWGEGYFPYLYRNRPDASYDPAASMNFAWDLYREMWGSHGEFVIDGNLKSVEYADRFSSIKVPTLITVGDHDECDPSLSEEMHRAIAGSKLVVFPESGHMTFVDQPNLFHRTVDDFLHHK